MTSARRQLVPLPSNLNTGKGPTPQGHPCFSFRPLEQLKGKTALKGKWAEMNGDDRQNQISPPSPSGSTSSHLLTRSHMQSDHFFSYDSATTVGPSDQYQLQKSILQLRLLVRFPATISPTTPHDGWTKTPPWRRRASQPDTNRWLLPPPSSIPIGTRPQAGSKLQSDQNQPRKSAIAAKASQPDTKSVASACSPPLFRPQSDHGPNLAQSYSRNNRNT